MNRMTVIGRIVRETELRAVGEGKFVMNNTIAIPRAFKSENGQDTDFLNFVAWGKRAELIEEFCNKGDLIGLDGRIQSRTYQKDSEQKVYIVEMNVESVYFLQNRRKKNIVDKSNPQPKQEEKPAQQASVSAESATQTQPALQNTTIESNRQDANTQGNDKASVSGTEMSIDFITTANS